MLGRRRIDTSAPLRSSLANAAFAVEERVVWGGVDILRSIAEAIKWPFERIVWALESGLVWPLEERTGKWSGPVRAAGVAALALLAVGAGVLGLVWASGSGGNGQPVAEQATASVPAPIIERAVTPQPTQAAPVLQGATPNFTPAKAGAASKAGDDTAAAGAIGDAATTHAPTSSEDPAQSSSSAAVVPAGPAATKVARQFSGAFVLYETGRDEAKVRAAFKATATPALAASLLQRPPRLPADVEVPKAKILNVVPGPVHGDTYTLSVSMLRVGVTSELRIDMERDEKSGEWQVTDVRG
jgi:hypothetical protein